MWSAINGGKAARMSKGFRSWLSLVICILCLIQPNGNGRDSTQIDVLEPKSCIPGAQLFYAKDEDAEDEIMFAILHGKPPKPDATIVSFDASSQVVQIKRNVGSLDRIKLSDPGARHWMVVYEKNDSIKGGADIKTVVTSWQTSWDAFLTLAEQELNRSPANTAPPWQGKEVTWEGTVNDMEVMMAKNLVRLVFDMPERTLTINRQPVAAGRLMIFVPMQYENLAAVKKGATVRFKTTIAPVDSAHPAVSAQPGKNGAEGFLLVFTKGGTLLK